MEGLDISKIPFDLIINILNIAIMFVIVRLLVYKPVRKFMDERTKKLNQASEEAQSKLDEANSMRAEYEKLMSESKQKSAEILKQSREDADRASRDIVEAAHRKADKMMEETAERIRQKENEAKLQMREDIIDLSLSIASKLMDKNMTDEDNMRMAQDFFDKESKGWS